MVLFTRSLVGNPLRISISSKGSFVFTITQRKEGSVLVNEALNAFYLRLNGDGHMVKDHSDSERGNLYSHMGYSFRGKFKQKRSFKAFRFNYILYGEIHDIRCILSPFHGVYFVINSKGF